MTDKAQREQENEQLEQWLLKLDAGDVAKAEYEALNRWLAASPGRRERFAELSVVWFGSAIVDGRAWSSGPPAHARAGLGRPLALAAVLLLACGMIWLLARSPTGDLVVPGGPAMRQQLADSSTIFAKPGTVLDFEMSSDQRRLTLRSGAIYVQAAEDGQRPLSVVARHGVVTVVGTTFGVQLAQDSMTVGVTSGQVRVQSERFSGETLAPGEAASIGRHGFSRSSLADSAYAWIDGQLIFEETPLREALRTLGEYSPRRTIALMSVPDTPISAVVAVENVSDAIDALAKEYNLTVFRPMELTILF